MAHRPRWTLSQVTELFEKPLLDLLFEAQQVHRQHFDPRQVQVSTLLSIKTGACPEDCKYCPQSSRYKTGLEAERLMEVEQVLESARKAKAAQQFDPRQVQVSTLMSIKTGACTEDCKYCPQSSRYKTGLEAERLMEVEQVLESARKAKAA